jgi:ligand-binding sensor domain-containing protein
MKRPVSILAAWVSCCLAAHGQPESVAQPGQADFMIKSWSMADGLPHLSVTALAQTSDGYIWVGTLAGLARFDGVRFKVFTPQNCPQLPRSRVGALFTANDGTLFIATERGGGLVALRHGRFQQLLGSGNEQDEVVACVREPGGDSLFIARSGALWRWDGQALTTLSTNRAFYPVSPSSVCLDPQGRLWMLSRVDEAGRLLRLSSGRHEPVPQDGRLLGAQVRALARDSAGRIWLGTSKGLAFLRGDQFEPVELPEPGSELNVTALAAARDGGLWVCGWGYWQRKYKDGRWLGVGSENSIAGPNSCVERTMCKTGGCGVRVGGEIRARARACEGWRSDR